ncbi:YodL domain-containing protein [Paenibacillus periandrae]|uniref:YodL domain-containing protein n=1 Tax=Paenibacillus periandrae TaxID=1761741 RepID=UPI001F089808|nr:YodL domain-containing protein [Paenibacillus periandrae]
MSTLIVSQINVFMTKKKVEFFLNVMQDIIQIASNTEIKKEGRRTMVSITMVTPKSEYLDFIINRISVLNFDFNEKRFFVHEIEKAYQSVNEVCIWQIDEFYIKNLPLDASIQTYGKIDLSRHKRVYGGTLAGLNIESQIKENKIVKDVYHTFNFLRPSQCLGILIQVGDIIQIRKMFFYVNQFGFRRIKL